MEIPTHVVTRDGKRRRRRERQSRPSNGGISVGLTAKKKDQALLDDLKRALKTLNKMPMDGAAIADKFGRKKLGAHLDGAVAFMNELCAAFQIERIELTGVTDVPAGLNVEAWSQWVAYRKEAKLKTYTPTSVKKQMDALAQHPNEKQQEIVELSIRNQYQGLFPKKDVNRGTRRQSAVERAQRATGGARF